MLTSHRLYSRLYEELSSYTLALRLRALIHGFPPSKKFVIISNIRSGSTLLTRIANSHPNITCFFEPFHAYPVPAMGQPGYQRIRATRQFRCLRSADPYAFVCKYIWGNLFSLDNQAVGFKLIYTQARLDSWWKQGDYRSWWEAGVPPVFGSPASDLWSSLRQNRDVCIIHLTRSNVLAGLVSSKTASLTGSWGDGASGGFQLSDNIKVHLEIPEIIRSIESTSRFVSEIRDWFAHHPYLEFDYDDLISNRTLILSRLFDMLAVPRIFPANPTRKLRGNTLCDAIANVGYITDAFRGTRYESLIHRWLKC